MPAVAREALGLEVWFVREELGAVVAVDGEGGGDCGAGGELGEEGPGFEEKGSVGGYLEACLGLGSCFVSLEGWKEGGEVGGGVGGEE